MSPELKQQIEQFRLKTEQFFKDEISVKDYKGFSGKYGSYSQRGKSGAMLRLRMTGGRLSVERLGSIADICKKYGIDKLHCTTCETIQLHDIPFEIIADVMEEAINSGFYTLGGGGDFPRNVMASPLSGVEKGENLDVFPYAEKAAEYLLTLINSIKMPRKLKVCFSNSPANAVHATFRDLGFVSRPDGKFDVYIAGGMGNNPKIGVKAAEAVDSSKIIYCIKAMVSMFCKYGNYENRAKARTRYMQDTLGADITEIYNAELKTALDVGGLDIKISPVTISKKGHKTDYTSPRLIEQKQDGLYAVKYHPIGGTMNYNNIQTLYEVVKDIDDVSLRVSPDETIYIANCTGDEAVRVIEMTGSSAVKPIEESVACIGASICQQGLRDSQELLKSILDEVGKYNFPADALPVLHISGCTSSCGTHQIGKIGFHGKVKMIDGKPHPGFSLHLNGCDEQGHEHFGDAVGVIASDDIPAFIAEIGKAAAASGMSYDSFAANKHDELKKIIEKYI